MQDLRETKEVTRYTRDAFGNEIPNKEEYSFERPVKTVGVWFRLLHYFVDVACIQIILQVIDSYLFPDMSEIKAYTDQTIITLMAVVHFAMYPLYYFAFEFLWQRTPGKLVSNTYVINDFAEKPTAGQVFLRTIIRAIPFEALSCLGDKHSYGWHDKWAKTYVVPRKEYEKLRELLGKGNYSDTID